MHRHTPAALRFVIEGEGGWTDVDGTRYQMSPGDVIRTPNWTWHGHAHAATATSPMIWLDGLDLPLIHDLPVVFAEFTESERPERHAGQLRASGHAEQVRHRDQDAGLGEHGVHLRLESGA
ncbi:MAG: cupin domain-containing protein [Hyphomicrobiales bacterium]|nr:MAG: cupin domain-containing protein [Hyphomicrobiales bacterium]